MSALDIFTIGFGASSLLAGLALCGYAFVQQKRISGSARWPATDGRVVATSVETTIAGPGINYLPSVSYEYWVEDARFVNDRLEFIPKAVPSKDDARLITQRYPVGGQVTVYYSPDELRESVLRRGWPNSGSRYFPWRMGVCLLVVGLVFFVAF